MSIFQIIGKAGNQAAHVRAVQIQALRYIPASFFQCVGHGLGIALGEPQFVTDIDPQTNDIVLGPESELGRNGMFVHHLNFQKWPAVEPGIAAASKIRYKTAPAPSRLYPEGEDLMKVHFDAPINAITPGQSAVFYDGDDVIGGGHIMGHFQWEDHG